MNNDCRTGVLTQQDSGRCKAYARWFPDYSKDGYRCTHLTTAKHVTATKQTGPHHEKVTTHAKHITGREEKGGYLYTRKHTFHGDLVKACVYLCEGACVRWKSMPARKWIHAHSALPQLCCGLSPFFLFWIIKTAGESTMCFGGTGTSTEVS